MNHNKYQRWAYVYDKDPRNMYSDDLQFYLEYAQKAGSPILELACGTGRVTFPIAEAGYTIFGLDHSQSMVNVFRDKYLQKSKDIQSRITVCLGDMERFEFGIKFNLIIIPFRSFQALNTDDQIYTCLSSVRGSLTDDGVFIVNVFKTNGTIDPGWAKNKHLDWTVYDNDTGAISRYSWQKKHDHERQILEVDMTFIVTKNGIAQEEFTDSLSLKYYSEDQLATILEGAGFKIIERYGTYSRGSIQDGNEMIFVCKLGRG